MRQSRKGSYKDFLKVEENSVEGVDLLSEMDTLRQGGQRLG